MPQPSQTLTVSVVTGALITLLSAVADALRAFGVYDLTPAQGTALNNLVLALAGFSAIAAAGYAYYHAHKPAPVPPPPAPASLHARKKPAA